MSEDAAVKTLWTQSMFESLFSALRSGGDDERIREVVESLSDKGYSTSILIDKVRKAEGPKAAARVMRLCGAEAGAEVLTQRPRYKLSRAALVKKRLGHWWADVEDQFGELWYRIQCRFGRG